MTPVGADYPVRNGEPASREWWCLGARVCGPRAVVAARARSRRLGTRISKESARSGLRRELILVDEPAQQVTAAQAIEDDHVGESLLGAERRPLPECPGGAMLV